jgi:hypothetical protein
MKDIKLLLKSINDLIHPAFFKYQNESESMFLIRRLTFFICFVLSLPCIILGDMLTGKPLVSLFRFLIYSILRETFKTLGDILLLLSTTFSDASKHFLKMENSLIKVILTEFMKK